MASIQQTIPKLQKIFLFGKFPQQSIDIDFEISINSIKIIRSKYVKHLGLWLDDDLKFHTHVQHLAKYTGMFYRIRSYLKIDVIITAFYSFIYSKLPYDILTWDSAKK